MDLSGIDRIFKDNKAHKDGARDIKKLLELKERDAKDLYKKQPSIQERWMEIANRETRSISFSADMLRWDLGKYSDEEWHLFIESINDKQTRGEPPFSLWLSVIGDRKKMKLLWDPDHIHRAAHKKYYGYEADSNSETDIYFCNVAVGYLCNDPVVESLLHALRNSKSHLQRTLVCEEVITLIQFLPSIRMDLKQTGLGEVIDTIRSVDLTDGVSAEQSECWAKSVFLLSRVLAANNQISQIDSLSKFKDIIKISAGTNPNVVPLIPQIYDSLDEAAALDPLIIQYILPSGSARTGTGQVGTVAKGQLESLDNFLARTRSMNAVDKGNEFENYCGQLLELEGYTVEIMGGSGDRGADLIVKTGGALGETWAVQCKHYENRTVGSEDVIKTEGSKSVVGADKTMVITTGTFTRAAMLDQLNSKNTIVLWDRKKIEELSAKHSDS